MKRLWRDYSLSLTLAALFLVSWLLQALFQLGVEGESFGAFLAATFENWESEFLQLFTFVVLATRLVHKDSPQSRDGDDAMKEQLDRIEQELLPAWKKRGDG